VFSFRLRPNFMKGKALGAERKETLRLLKRGGGSGPYSWGGETLLRTRKKKKGGEYKILCKRGLATPGDESH